jgi:pentatricopeptide repeat protein
MVAPADRIVHLYHRGCRWNSFLYTTAWQQKLFDASLSLFPEREDKDRSSGLSSFTIQKEKTRSFLDESTYPLGSFSDAHFSDIKITLETISRQNIRDSDSLELALDLLERLLRELRVRFRAKHARWICHPRFFNGILHNYQVAAKIGVRTGPPEIVWKRLLTMAQILPEFQLDNVTVAILFDAMLHFRPPLEKPHFAEHFLNDLWDKWRRNPQPALPRPDRNVYALVLLAWSNSKLPVAGEKIENLIGDMRTENVAFDEITYNIFMRYFAERGEQGKVESILEEMIKDGVKPTRTTLSHMIYCYCYVGDAFKAEKVLRQLVGLHPKNDRESNIVGETVQMILSVHRKNLENCSDEMEKTRIMRSAENLFQSLEKIAASNEQDRSKFVVCRSLVRILCVWTRA